MKEFRVDDDIVRFQRGTVESIVRYDAAGVTALGERKNHMFRHNPVTRRGQRAVAHPANSRLIAQGECNPNENERNSQKEDFFLSVQF